MSTIQEVLQQGWNLHQQRKFDEAETIYRNVLAQFPTNAAAWCYLGIALHDKKKFDAAIEAYHQALQCQPEFPVAWNNLGNSFRAASRVVDAERAYLKALEQKPDYVNAHKNRGTLHVWNGRIGLAMECYDQAMKLAPDDAELHRNLGIIHLMHGKFEKGWEDFQWRWKVGDLKRPQVNAPLWDGSDLKGKTIFLYPEQGLGDTLQYIRFAQVLKAQGATTIVQCQSQLLGLLQNIPGVDCLLAPGVPLVRPVDFHCSLLDVPAILKLDIANMQPQAPYLKAHPGLVQYWGKQLEQLPPGPRVALAWQGNPDFHADPYRSVKLAEMAPLGELENIQWISLQLGYGSEQAQSWRGKRPLAVFGSPIDQSNGPFMDTAAILQHVDVLISVDTSIAHLAGALGVPTWLALHYVPDWRWLLNRQDTPWYPKTRLFRQPSLGDWRSVFLDMKQQLQTLAPR